VKLCSKNSNLCDHNSPTSQTDRQTTRSLIFMMSMRSTHYLYQILGGKWKLSIWRMCNKMCPKLLEITAVLLGYIYIHQSMSRANSCERRNNSMFSLARLSCYLYRSTNDKLQCIRSDAAGNEDTNTQARQQTIRPILVMSCPSPRSKH